MQTKTRADLEPLVWNTPGGSAVNSVPLGNGDIALNVWVEKGGDVLFYIAKADAWDENARLVKLGRMRLSIEGNPLAGPDFRQEFRIRDGCVLIHGGDTDVKLWVDANHPAIRIDIQSQRPRQARCAVEIWRTQRRQLQGKELHSAWGLLQSADPVFVEPDDILPARDNRLCWCHHNRHSIWEANLRLQGLESLLATQPDPLLQRTFGAMCGGDGWIAQSDQVLQSPQGQTRHTLTIACHTLQRDIVSWRTALDGILRQVEQAPPVQAWPLHEAWWRAFWDRSYIILDGDDQARLITQRYALQRYMNACAGRGAQPIKFNGSLFTVDWGVENEEYDADYRRWGGCYWFQNTRLAYWPMLGAGDGDLLAAFFTMYRDALPLAEARTRIYFGHEGAYFPETMYFWGTWDDDCYGRDRSKLPVSEATNPYIRYYWSGGLELLSMGLQWHRQQRDPSFFDQTLLPLARSILQFYARHYPRDAAGLLRIEPAEALETYHQAVNPTPEIAGLRHVLEGMLDLQDKSIHQADRQAWRDLLEHLPPLPIGHDPQNPKKGFVLPAEQFSDLQNSECPELYAIFPYRQFGLGRQQMDVALETWNRRQYRETIGWRQHAIWAALLGLADEAAQMVFSHFSTSYSASQFPAYWGPNFDWIPDQDHGNVPMLALQYMLLQSDGAELRLAPALPARWSAHFKLHAPDRTIVEAQVAGGKVVRQRIEPLSRQKDVR